MHGLDGGTGRMMKAGTCARVRSADQSGKVFRIEQGMRRCMVCERLFSQEASQQHADVACRPVQESSGLAGTQRRLEYSSEFAEQGWTPNTGLTDCSSSIPSPK